MSLIYVVFIQSLLFTLARSQGSCKETSGAELTFYGFPDGQSDTTSFACGARGNKAGGTGSYLDPESFATAQSNSNFKNCDIVYIPYFQKYFQYADHCVQCDSDFKAGTLHLDLWIGTSTNGGLPCEQSFGSLSGQTIISNPPSDLPVNSGALWDGSACHDASSQNPFVYPNPSTSGLCSGGTSSPSGGSPAEGTSTSASTPSVPTSISTPVPTTSSPPAIHNLAVQQTQTPVVPSPEPTSTQLTLPGPPTTLLTSVVMSSSSSSVTPITSSSAGGASDTSDCASWGGCLGDPCHSYNDCAGDWICMGSPKKCVDNRMD